MIFASDFSFAERAIIEVWVWSWFIHRVWSTDKFSSLQWSKIRNFDLKSIITLLILIMLPVQAIFDMIWTYLKYSEGFYKIDNKIVTKPAYYIESGTKIQLWTHEHILLKNITEYLLACGFAFQIGTLTLMQAFWSHLSSQMGGKPFMRSWKSKFYFGLVFASMIVFPSARALSSNNIVFSENIPSLIFAIFLLVISFLGIKNGRRLNRLYKSIQQQSSSRGQETIRRIQYFTEMNRVLTFGALLIGIGLSTITIDAIFHINVVTQSKLLADLLLIHTNFGSLMLWCTMILIVYPRCYVVGSDLDHNSSEDKSKSFVVNIAATAATNNTTTARPKLARGSSSYAKIEKSVSNLLEQQQYQIDCYRHRTCTSISSSTATLTSSAPNSPLIPPPIYESSTSIDWINPSD